MYIDTDNDPTTGRSGLGVEEQISFSNLNVSDGSIYVKRVRFNVSGDKTNDPEPMPTIVVDGSSLYIRYDDVIKREENGRFFFRFSALSKGWIASQDRYGGISKTPLSYSNP